MIFTISPYLPGKGPTLHIDLLNCTMTAFDGGDSRLVFKWDANDYRPPACGETDIQEACSLFKFAEAYAERGEEFDRSPEDAEQLAIDWWDEHGEAMSCEVSYLEDEG
tara:strand:- start:926 stop:1249 length:324 start_codon:yes stop_codon:yes gene_type:complete